MTPIAKGLGLVVLGIALGVALSVAARWPRSEVVYRGDQPATVAYTDDSKHVLALVRRSALLGESHQIVVGRDPSLSYGHRVDIETSAGVKTTEWTTAGVRVLFDSGHELFIPARFFIGGR
ncbi:hypothetical protein [Nonomuraea endophytica]|uniref:Uncharacterized protein n=1 Tax=Nonomuraea endophytica TaxID=714136 RepID=A0A7W8ADC2_9ACTN|nr:hypothetical protein [Nonomuraea endophytica]MBB5084015.1 hypothetical protein [Nonomuraea endophytica]